MRHLLDIWKGRKLVTEEDSALSLGIDPRVAPLLQLPP